MTPSLIDRMTVKFPQISGWLFKFMLWALAVMLRGKRLLSSAFRQRLREKTFSACIKVRDNSIGRTFVFKNGRVRSTADPSAEPDVCVIFKDAAAAVQLLTAPRNYMKQINAMKNFLVDVEGQDEYAIWFMQTLQIIQPFGDIPTYGTPMGNEVMRYVSNTNGGPVFVYVKE